MYERIVVGTDCSERSQQAVDQAASLALLCDAELALVQGCGSPIVGVPMFVGDLSVNPELLTEGAEERLEAIAAPLRSQGLRVTVHPVAESGHAALCKTAADVDADLIVVGNRGMTGAGRFLGSVPNAVTHQAPCSVLIVTTD